MVDGTVLSGFLSLLHTQAVTWLLELKACVPDFAADGLIQNRLILVVEFNEDDPSC